MGLSHGVGTNALVARIKWRRQYYVPNQLRRGLDKLRCRQAAIRVREAPEEKYILAPVFFKAQ